MPREVIAVYKFVVADDVLNSEVGQITADAFAQLDDAMVYDVDGNRTRIETSDVRFDVVIGQVV